MLKIRKGNLELLTLIYLCFMTAYMAVREVLPLNFLIDSTLVSTAVFVPGVILILWDVFTARKCLSGRSQDMLIAFLIVCAISSLLNFRYGIFGNVKFIAALAIEYFIFFCFTKNMPIERSKKYLNVLSGTLIIVWLLLVLASLATYFFGIDITVFDYGAASKTSQGFSYKYVRLWGIFQDPNYASSISLISVFASVRLMVVKKRPVLTVLLAINIFCQICYIMLGGSRAALVVALTMALLFAVSRLFLDAQKHRLKAVASMLASFVICVVALFGTKFALPFVKNALFTANTKTMLAVSDVYRTLYSLSDLEFKLVQRDVNGKKIANESANDTKSDGTVIPLDRTDLGKTDVSNGRFKRWGQSLQVFSKAPVFGTSPRNMQAFAKQHNPKTLMAKNGTAPHNGYLDVLVETGVVGFVVLATAVLSILVYALKRFWKDGFSYDRVFLVLSVIAFMGSAVFISDIYMTFSINSMFFWIFFGMAFHWDTEWEAKGVAHTIYMKTIGKWTDKLFAKKG